LCVCVCYFTLNKGVSGGRYIHKILGGLLKAGKRKQLVQWIKTKSLIK
jgi:hypothetical protein